MITLLEYLAYLNEGKYDRKKDEVIYPHLQEIQEYNKALIVKYPFLLPRNRWTDKVVDDYDFTWTELDAMPKGWRIRFGEEMVEEISQELKKYNFEDGYRIIQVKEKWGGLRWYDGGVPLVSAIHDIVRKYENLSHKICIACGDLAVYRSKGWISPWCKNCKEEQKNWETFDEITVEDYEN